MPEYKEELDFLKPAPLDLFNLFLTNIQITSKFPLLHIKQSTTLYRFSEEAVWEIFWDIYPVAGLLY